MIVKIIFGDWVVSFFFETQCSLHFRQNKFYARTRVGA